MKKPKQNITETNRVRNDDTKSFSKNTAEQYGVSERWVQEKVQATKILETKPELAELKSAKKIIRTNKLQEQKQELETNTQEKPTGLFNVIVVDPPWKYFDRRFKGLFFKI